MTPTDTHPDAAREQIRLLRQASPRERFARACSLTQSARAWSLQGLRERMPDAGEAEIRIAWAKLLYGERLVRALGVDEGSVTGEKS